jgi:aryl-alcohol dehydrogenase-like predicted oxidoreductase
MVDSRRMERRRLADSAIETSVIGVVIDPASVASPEADDQLVGQIRRLREAGVTTFDLSAARSVSRGARVLRRALVRGDSEICLIVREETSSAEEAPSIRNSGSTGSEVDRSIAADKAHEALADLHELGAVLVQIAGEKPPTDRRGWAAGRFVLPWSARSGRGAKPSLEETAAGYSTELSLLDTHSLPSLRAENPSGTPRIFVRNAFADGRLDGSRFGGPGDLRRPSATPIDLRTLHEEFDPVLRLAPLTQARTRTLAQAAVRFVVRWPWVAAVLLPLEPPERWDEILGSLAVPELTDAELGAAGVLWEESNPRA